MAINLTGPLAAVSLDPLRAGLVTEHEPAGRHGIGHRAAAAAAAADQGQANCVVLGSMDAWQVQPRQSREGGDLGGVLEKITTRHPNLLSFTHGEHSF